MALFHFIFRKFKKDAPAVSGNGVSNTLQEVLVQYDGKHIVYNLQQGLITYRNVVSPRDAGRSFPEGYFDAKTKALSVTEQTQLLSLIEGAVSSLPFCNALDILPPGASHKALMILTGSDSRKVFYSNCHATGSSVRTEEIRPSFLMLFNTLHSFCSF